MCFRSSICSTECFKSYELTNIKWIKANSLEKYCIPKPNKVIFDFAGH